MRIERTWLPLLVGCVLCAGVVVVLPQWQQGRRQFSKTDEWFTGGPDVTTSDWVQLPRKRVFPVNREQISAASAPLADQQWVRLEYKEAGRIAGATIPRLAGATPILLRGVQLSHYHHRVEAHLNGSNELLVRVIAYSRWPLPMLRRPLIVVLPKFPTRLYVDAEVREERQEAE